MSEELVVSNQNSALALQDKYGQDVLDLVQKSSSFMPRVQLCISRSKICEAGKFPVNHFAVIQGDDYTDLGTTVDMAVFAWRPKAMQILEKSIVVCYDPKVTETVVDGRVTKSATGLFKEIADRSSIKDSGCMFGPEYLVWIPKVKQFATMYFGSTTMRNESGNMTKIMQGNRLATATSRLIETKTGRTYTSTVIKGCFNPMELPDASAIEAEVRTFLTPPEKAQEAADDIEKANTTRAQ